MTNAQRSLRRNQIAGLIALALLVGGIGGWSYFSSIAGAVIAHSTVVVESKSSEVQHLEGGIISQVLVQDGDYVNAGEVLVNLDDTDTKANLEIINTQLYELLARKARLEAERDDAEDLIFSKELTALSGAAWIERMIAGQRKLFASRRDLLNSQKEQLLSKVSQSMEEITGLNAQLDAINKQAGFLEEELAGLASLKEDGLVSISRVMNMEREYAQAEGERGRLLSDIARVKTIISETRLEIIQIDQDAETKVLEELRDIQPKIAELFERQLSATAKLRRVGVIAPRAGYIHELSVIGEGGVVSAGQIIMLIVPEKGSLVLDAQLNPQDIDQVTIGQQVVINFPAFSANETPRLNGEVYRISADLIQEDPQQPPHYLARVKLNQGEVEKLKDKILKPGMPAEVYIQTGSRSALSYLVKPFMDQFNRAFRE